MFADNRNVFIVFNLVFSILIEIDAELGFYSITLCILAFSENKACNRNLHYEN